MHYAINYVEDNYLDSNITIFEIKTQLAKAKANKAPGEDRISYEFFKNAPENFLETLSKVYTNILQGQTRYDVFHKSLIFPIYKKGVITEEFPL